MKRIHSIDITRGLAMIIMALDHTRDLMHVNSITQSPTDLATTTPFLFFTRWITHLCAPTFVFLSGVSAWLSFSKKANIATSRNFLLSRGLWLIILELTFISFAITLDFHLNVLLFQVIGTIGIGFIILALCLKIPAKILGIVGLLIIFTHNAVPLVPFAEGSVIKAILSPLFGPAAIPIPHGITLVVGYPPIPWLGIMLAGFGIGYLFQMPVEYRKNILLKIGIGALLLFVIIRFMNIYGDPVPWSAHSSPLYTFLSFFNLTKYPPSLLFDLPTLGIMFLVLYFSEGTKNKLTTIANVYGKVPLFYFLVHFYILRIIMLVMMRIQGFKFSDLEIGFNLGRPKATSGVPLFAIYLIWIAVVIILYPVCKWYGNYKDSHPEKKWLRYL